MKYNVGDRVRIKNFDWFRNEGANIAVTFMMKYYGEVVTIKSVHKDFYRIKEDGRQYCWTDEMIECKMEEETKIEPKFKVGDKIKHKCDKNNIVITIIGSKYDYYYIQYYNNRKNEYQNEAIFFTDQDKYEMIECKAEEESANYSKVIDNGVSNPIIAKTSSATIDTDKGFYSYSDSDGNLEMEWNLPQGCQFVDENGNVINAQKIVLEKLVVPKFKKGDKIKDKNNRVWYVEQVGKKHFDISRVPNGGSGYFVPIEDQDYYELVPDRELPKTFEECVSVLEGENRMTLEQMNTFRKLIDTRNAYWKLYGEEKGLGKPWEPDWNIRGYYAIARSYGNVVKTSNYNCDLTFVFPTEEMRDKFYENFKKEIEICKELL